MESPYSSNVDDEHPEEKNYALENPEMVKHMIDLIDKWEKDLFLYTSAEEE